MPKFMGKTVKKLTIGHFFSTLDDMIEKNPDLNREVMFIGWNNKTLPFVQMDQVDGQILILLDDD